MFIVILHSMKIVLDTCTENNKFWCPRLRISLHANITCGHVVAYWLRYYATSRKVAGSRPDKVNKRINKYGAIEEMLYYKTYTTMSGHQTVSK
jgi:hypothetical protein